MNIRELLEEYASFKEVKERVNYAVEHLALLSSIEQKNLLEQMKKEGEKGFLYEKLAELDQLRFYFAKEPERFPFGKGPIEQVAQRIINDKVSLDAGIEEVCREGFEQHLAPVYVQVLRNWATKTSSTSNFKYPTTVMRLITESCLKFGTTDELDSASDYAIRGWMDVVKNVLVQRPYGELFKRAVELGELALERAVRGNQTDQISIILHALGSLYADPWTVNRDIKRYSVSLNLWMRLMESEMGATRFAQYQKQYPLPSPQEAFETAIFYYERALEFKEGEDRGDTLKAILQCLAIMNIGLEVEVDRGRIEKLCKEAIALLQPGNYNRNTVLMIADQYKIDLLGQDYDKEIDKQLSGYLPDMVIQEAIGLAKSNPQEAVRRLLAVRDKFTKMGSEHLRHSRLHQLVNMIPAAHGIDHMEIVADEPHKELKALEKKARKEKWPKEKKAAAIFALASRTTASNTENEGLEILGQAEVVSDSFSSRYAEVFQYLSTILQMQAAVNMYDANQHANCIMLYAGSLKGLLDCKLLGLATDVIVRIGDVAASSQESVTFSFLSSLAPIVLRIEKELGEGGSTALQQALSRLFRNFASGPGFPNEITTAMQLGKSIRFCSQIRNEQSLDWRNDEAAMELVDEINQYGSPAIKYHSDIDETLLVSYSSEQIPTAGQTNEEKIENTQLRMEKYLSHKHFAGDDSFAFIPTETIQESLSKKTVLIDYFFAEVDSLQRGLFIVLYTHDERQFYYNVIPEKLQNPNTRDLLGDDNSTIILRKPIAEKVMSIRKLVQLAPKLRTIHRRASSQLTSDFDQLIGSDLWEHLNKLREKGYDHLCISPHGALRYYPFALLGDGEKILADYWTVTSIPSLDYLLPKECPAREVPISVMGISYKKGYSAELPMLKHVKDEAAVIADVYGVVPLLDADVNRKSMIHALCESSYVHIIAHGMHDAAAPMFQSLFLTPDSKSDGRFYAYELLGLDLSGLEIVTLSACETALGRFDIGDNIRGLPAALFLAGVSSIVAGLWDVSDAAADTFFTSFYRSLRDKKNRLEAFRIAQQETRCDFPQARDWAAFQFIGRTR